MDSGRDMSVYSAKKTYNRLIGKVDYSHTHTRIVCPLAVHRHSLKTPYVD